MTSISATIAANRFGFGARPGQLAEIGSDGRGWLLEQMDKQRPLAEIENVSKRYTRILGGVEDQAGLMRTLQQNARPLYMQDVTLRTRRAVLAEASFVERLVHFWSNHLAVSVDRPAVSPFAAGYENEAIRPHIFGSFTDMVLASARHPAMLLYLDNIRSLGPNSMAIRNRLVRQRGNGEPPPRGLNENYAREVMELHTVGVDAGYTQTDVRSLAKILTGWSLERSNGTFRFRAGVHEPGAQTVMGRNFAEDGEDQGIAALKFLATHPATAKHIATKLARHFIADAPPASAVAALENTFMRTGDDLAAVTRTLVNLEEAWSPQPLKFKSPHDHVVSALRAVGAQTVEENILLSFEVLGQRCFGAPSPQGWPDTEASWLSGDALLRRIEWCQALSTRLPRSMDAREIAPEALGPWLSGDTAFLLQGAPSPAEAVALLFLAPEFQRR